MSILVMWVWSRLQDTAVDCSSPASVWLFQDRLSQYAAYLRKEIFWAQYAIIFTSNTIYKILYLHCLNSILHLLFDLFNSSFAWGIFSQCFISALIVWVKMSFSGYSDRPFKPQLHWYVVSLRKAHNPHCFGRRRVKWVPDENTNVNGVCLMMWAHRRK